MKNCLKKERGFNMKTITIHLPDSAICGEFVYVNISTEDASLNALAIHDIQDGNNYAPEGEKLTWEE